MYRSANIVLQFKNRIIDSCDGILFVFFTMNSRKLKTFLHNIIKLLRPIDNLSHIVPNSTAMLSGRYS